MKRYCGRRFTGEEIGQLCALIADNPGRTRPQLSRLACRLLQPVWRVKSNGRDCRSLDQRTARFKEGERPRCCSRGPQGADELPWVNPLRMASNCSWASAAAAEPRNRKGVARRNRGDTSWSCPTPPLCTAWGIDALAGRELRHEAAPAAAALALAKGAIGQLCALIADNPGAMKPYYRHESVALRSPIRLAPPLLSGTWLQVKHLCRLLQWRKADGGLKESMSCRVAHAACNTCRSTVRRFCGRHALGRMGIMNAASTGRRKTRSASALTGGHWLTSGPNETPGLDPKDRGPHQLVESPTGTEREFIKEVLVASSA